MDKMLQHDFERYVTEVMNTYQAVGLGVAIVDPEKTLYQKTWGYRNCETEAPVDQQTIFGLASITKSFTCLAIMQLQEAGKLSVHDPVSKYLPEFAYPGAGTLTIENLMAHNGGYDPQPALGWSMRQHTERDPLSEEEREKEEQRLAAWRERYPEKRMDSFADIIAHLSDPEQRLLGRPGEVFSYSNDTYGVLGEIIKRLSGAASYEEYMEEHILRPLGMSRSWFEAERLQGKENVTTLYWAEKDKVKGTKHWQVAPSFTPCGFLKSTLEDMQQYLQMYLNQGKFNGNKLLGRVELAEMIKPCQPCQHQRYYGYGLSVQSVGSFKIIEHGGSLNGVSTHIAWSPELQKGVVILCNTRGVPVQLLATAALMWCAGQPVRQARISYSPATWSEATLDAAQGSYRSGEGALYRIAKNAAGELLIEIEGDAEKYLLHPVLPDLALVKIKMTETEVRLCRRDDGEVWAIQYGNRTVPRDCN